MIVGGRWALRSMMDRPRATCLTGTPNRRPHQSARILAEAVAPEPFGDDSRCRAVAILAGVSGPPAELPNVPASTLGDVILIVIVGLGGTYLVAGRAVRRIDVLGALRER